MFNFDFQPQSESCFEDRDNGIDSEPVKTCLKDNSRNFDLVDVEKCFEDGPDAVSNLNMILTSKFNGVPLTVKALEHEMKVCNN